VRRARECGLGRCGVAEIGVDGDVGIPALPQKWRGGCGRVRGDRDCRERLIFDVNPLGCVLCDLKRLGDDHRHRLADEARLVGGQR